MFANTIFILKGLRELERIPGTIDSICEQVEGNSRAYADVTYYQRDRRKVCGFFRT